MFYVSIQPCHMFWLEQLAYLHLSFTLFQTNYYLCFTEVLLLLGFLFFFFFGLVLFLHFAWLCLFLYIRRNNCLPNIEGMALCLEMNSIFQPHHRSWLSVEPLWLSKQPELFMIVPSLISVPKGSSSVSSYLQSEARPSDSFLRMQIYTVLWDCNHKHCW